jgi:STE24 endopeptidase
MRKVKAAELSMPELSFDHSNRAKKYSLLKYTISFIDTGFTLLFLFMIYSSGFSLLLKEISITFSKNKFAYTAFYIFFLGVIYYIFSFVIHFYGSFILEHRFKLSNQRFGDWLKDEMKKFILSFIVSLILIESFYFITYRFEDFWWIYVAILWIVFSIILTKILPTMILPLFFKYKSLEDKELKERILSLAEKLRIKILDVFEIDLSRKSLKANAGFLGLGRTKRVLLSDTLRDKFTPKETEIILAHEFAHFKLKHILKHILVNTIFILLLFYLVFSLSKFLKFSISDIANFPLLAILFISLGIIFHPFQNFISRQFERNADILSLKITNDKESFIQVMEKLANQNLSDRNPNLFIKLFFFDHPPIDERIKMAINFSSSN